MAKKVVSKFGGTSMADANRIRNSAEVAHARHSGLVVVSAISGVTNQLIELGALAEQGHWSTVEPLIQEISHRHLQIAEELNVSSSTRQSLAEILEELTSLARGICLLRECSLKARDTLMSLGERMSSQLILEALREVKREKNSAEQVSLIDARDYIKTDEQFGRARPLIQEIELACAHGLVFDDSQVYVTQGFIGSTTDGVTTTLGRGGSDFSAALFAYALDAETLEIWTDVPGIATTDPRIYPKARSLEEISFQEASELATFGAKILHPATLAPAIRKNIPTYVGSSYHPESSGTWVRKEVESHPLVRALALRKNQVLVTLTTPDMLHNYGFLFQIFKVFNDHKVSIDSVTTSEISVAMTLDDSTLLNKKMIQELSQFAEVQVEGKLSLVSIIGNNINHTPGLGQKIFEAIAGVNVRMTCHGASRHNFCFLVHEENGPVVIQRLHEAFIP